MNASTTRLLFCLGLCGLMGSGLYAVDSAVKFPAPMTRADSLKTPTKGSKEPFTMRAGDATMTFMGNARVDWFYEDNMYLLNKNIPDENEYFKEVVDFKFDVSYGEEKYEHKAVEVFADMRHKSVWGKGLSYADRDAGPIGPSQIKFGGENSQAIFGTHGHTSGKALLWFKDAWLRFSLNAAVGYYPSQRLHFLKLGWFPFEMGRGIALGSSYGLNKELLGLYSYSEDKSAPGINLNGVFIPDRLKYDLYFARFEEKNKSFDDVINLEKRHIVGRYSTPWRGVNKDDDLFAARINVRPIKSDTAGTLELEPYIFYNAASDQKVEMGPDAKVYWGSYGLQVEYGLGNFECGAETAFNYGKEELFNIDRNKAIVDNREGYIVELQSKIYDSDPSLATAKTVFVTPDSNKAAQADFYVNGKEIPGYPGYWNAKNRFRPAYNNRLAGWMMVVDGAYTIAPWNLKIAMGGGFASGDDAPHSVEKNKTYHGFVGLHETYNGKRIKSILILDERLLKRPVSATGDTGKVTALRDTTFSDLQLVQFGLTWAPKIFIKDLSLNSNVVSFWKAHRIHRYIAGTYNPATKKDSGYISPTEFARSYLGTEFNILSSCSVVRDLRMFANFALFFPGGFFADMKGIPLSDDYFKQVVQDERNGELEASKFRLSDDMAMHFNMGFEYKF